MINLCINNRWELTLLVPFVKCVERRVEYLCCCLVRSILSSSCWICVIISCPFKDTWQMGHCGFCRSYVDDRHRLSRVLTKGVLYCLTTSYSTHFFIAKHRKRKTKIDDLSCLFHPVFYSVSLVCLESRVWLFYDFFLFHLWITIMPYV